MSNRIAKYWTSMDALLDAASARAVDEAAQLQQSPYTAEQPLEVFLERKYLQVVIEVSLRKFKKVLSDPALDSGVRTQLEGEVAQRQQFLRWLAANPKQQVYCNVSPAAEYPLPVETPAPEGERDW